MKSVLISFIVVIFFSGCTPHYQEPPKTQLQIREIQSREFDTADSKLVMKSMMNVLQDEGFIIKNAVLDLGLLNAERSEDIKNRPFRRKSFKHKHHRSKWWDEDLFDDDREDSWDKQKIFEASANVSEFGNKTRVRINFLRKTIDNNGHPSDTKTIMDPVYYQNFFEKVSKGIFIQQENI